MFFNKIITGIAMKDTIYQSNDAQQGKVTPFEFNEEVVRVFDDMISRSVPGYRASIELAMVLAAEICQPNDHIYDLGCSLGAATFALLNQKALPQLHITGIDKSIPMLHGFQKIMQSQGHKPTTDSLPLHYESINHQQHVLDLEEADLVTMAFKPSKLVLLNYVLQFIKVEQRAALLTDIHKALQPGGVLLLSEKIICENQEHHAFIDKLHLRFKSLQGYSELEIAGKRSAIENVLIPETYEAHEKRLKEAGFSQVIPVLTHLNFMTILAVK